ncbi:unnamed protein product, partial [Musa acuminata var. zebrina]
AEINLENPVLEFDSPPYAGQSCHRVRLTGMSRLNLKSYASSVSLVLLGGIIFAGTFLGYWSARKFVLSEDGCVDSGIAQFVKWTLRLIGIVSILQSTIDVPLGLLALATCCTFSYLVHSKKWHRRSNNNGSLWQRRPKQASSGRQAEILSFASKGTRMSFWGCSTSYSPSPNAAGKGYSFSKRVKQRDQDYYSTYHNVPRRKFSEEEWEKFTRQSTSAALTEWASTPEVIKWIGNNAHRMRLIEEDHNQDDTSESDSPKETVPRNESEPSFFTWL